MLAATFLAMSVEGLPLTQGQWDFIPMVILGGVSLLALRFNRSRLFFAVGAVGLLLYFLPRNFDDTSVALMVLSIFFCLLSVFRERGLKSWQAATCFVSMVLLATVPDWPASIRASLDDLLGFGAYAIWAEESPIQPMSILVLGFTFTFLLYRAVSTGHPFLSGLLGGLMAAVGAVLNTGFTSECFVLAAALCLLFAAIEMSHDLAFRDALTGLPGRRALEESLRHVGRPYTLAMVDVDHFKRFNDTYGHDAGDEALRMVGSELSRIEMGGKAFRYGGEEFTLLFAGKTVDEVAEAIEDVRKRLAERPFTIRDENRPKRKPKKSARIKSKRAPSTAVTVSIGVAASLQRTDTAKEVIKTADERLYNAKKAGRNRVVF